MALSTSKNSTNVRSESPLDPWPPRAAPPSCAPVLMLAAWTVFVVLIGLEGVFARLEIEAYIALAVFIVAYMVISSRVDDDAAALLRGARHPLGLALGLDTL